MHSLLSSVCRRIISPAIAIGALSVCGSGWCQQSVPSFDFIRGVWSEYGAAANLTSFKYTYRSKVLPGFDLYSKAANAFGKVNGLAEKPRDEEYAKKFPDWEDEYECVLYGLDPSKFYYSVKSLKSPDAETALHLSNGKLNWVVNPSDKVATLAKDSAPPWPPRYDVFLLGLPNGVGPETAKNTGENSIIEVISRAIPELSTINAVDDDLLKMRLVERVENPLMETYRARDLELIPSKGFALKSYICSYAVRKDGELKVLSPSLSVEYSKHLQQPSGFWLPGKINISQYASLPKEISKEAFQRFPWMPETTESYKIKEHVFELLDAVQEKEGESKFGLKIEDLGKGFRIVDEVSGNVFTVGDPLKDLGDEVDKANDETKQ